MSELLTESEYTSTIDAPIEALDLTEWVFTLADDEYQRCATAHIAAGASTDQAGKRVSIGRTLHDLELTRKTDLRHGRPERDDG